MKPRQVQLAVGLVLASMSAFLIADSSWLALAALFTGLPLGFLLRRDRNSAPPFPATESDHLAVDTRNSIPAQHMRALMDAIDDPLLLLTGRRVAAANKNALSLLGTHVEGEDIRVAIRHPGATRLMARHEKAKARSISHLDGFGGPERRWQMEINALDEETSLVRLIDLSHIVAADRMRTDFVANASHELRTPIAALLGFIETLQDPSAGNDSSTRERFLAIMATEARRMQQLVNDLISLSRIEADRYDPPDASVDLVALANNVAMQIAAASRLAEDRITVECAMKAAPVIADRAQIEQLLRNLIGNAIKYGRKDAPIRIRIKNAAGNMMSLAITDQGEGIAAEHLPRLTERFYRVDPGRSRANGGTGLGLAIVKNIVERHRGTLNFASRQGVGTTVTVNLPAPSPPSASEI